MTEKNLPTFAQWLARMAGNDTSIGTFAREMASDEIWASRGDLTNRGAILGYLVDTHAPAPRLAAFNHAWASYQTAIKRAQAGQAGAGNSAQGAHSEWTEDEIRSHDEWIAQGEPGAQDRAGSFVHVVTVPVELPCEECGGEVETAQWTIPGIGQGVLCRKCFDDVLKQIVTALGGQMGE